MTQSFRTPAFDAYIAPAKTTPQLWRMIASLIVIIGLLLVFLIALTTLTSHMGWVGNSTADFNMNTRPSMILGLAAFAGAIIGLWVAARMFHARSLQTMLGPLSAVRRNFVIAAGLVFVGQAIWMLLGAYLVGVETNQPLKWVMIFLPLAVILLLIQTGAEELLFRGYLMQQLAARFQSPLIWCLLPSIVFGLLHYNPETMLHMTWWVIIAITISGLAWADLTRVTGNIGAAWGWHFMNNFMLLNGVTLKGSMTAFSWKVSSKEIVDMVPLDIAPDIVFTIVVWFILRRVLRQA